MAKFSFISSVLILCEVIDLSFTIHHVHHHHHHGHHHHKPVKYNYIVPQGFYESPFGYSTFASFFNPITPSSIPLNVVQTSHHKPANSSSKAHKPKKHHVKIKHIIGKNYYVPASPALRPIEDFAKTIHDLAKMVHDMHPEKANAAQKKALAGKGMHLKNEKGKPAKDFERLSHDIAILVKDTEKEVDANHLTDAGKPQTPAIDKLDKITDDIDNLLDHSHKAEELKKSPDAKKSVNFSSDTSPKKHHGGKPSPAVARTLNDFDRGVHASAEMIMNLRPDIKKGQPIPTSGGEHVLDFDPSKHRNPIIDIVNIVDDITAVVLDTEEEMDPEGDHVFDEKKLRHGRKHNEPAKDIDMLSKDLSNLVKDVEEEVLLAKTSGKENPRITGLAELLQVVDDMALSLHHGAVADEIEKKHQQKVEELQKRQQPQTVKQSQAVKQLQTSSASEKKESNEDHSKKTQHERITAPVQKPGIGFIHENISIEKYLSEEDKSIHFAKKCAQRALDCHSCLVDNDCFFCATDNTCLPTLNFTTTLMTGDRCALKDVYFMHACKVKFITTIIIWVFAAFFAILIIILLIVFFLSFKRNKSKLYKRIQSKERELLDAPEFANTDFGVHDFDQ